MVNRKSDQYLALEAAIQTAVRGIRREQGFRKTEIAVTLTNLHDMQTALGED